MGTVMIGAGAVLIILAIALGIYYKAKPLEYTAPTRGASVPADQKDGKKGGKGNGSKDKDGKDQKNRPPAPLTEPLPLAAETEKLVPETEMLVPETELLDPETGLYDGEAETALTAPLTDTELLRQEAETVLPEDAATVREEHAAGTELLQDDAAETVLLPEAGKTELL